MDEIDRRVGFEQVAPHPFAGMGFARHQQHPQAVAHAVDDDDGALVDRGQRVRPRLNLQLEHIGAAMIDQHRQCDVLADRRHQLLRGTAVLAPGHARLVGVLAGLFGGAERQVLDPDLQLQLLADDAETRRLRDHQPAVLLVRLPRQQNVQGCGNRLPQGLGVAARHVVYFAVGDHDDAGEALARHIRHRPVERREQSGALVLGAGRRRPGADHAQVEIGLVAELLLDRGESGCARLPPVANVLARRVVENDDRDIAPGHTLLFDQRRIDQCCEQHGQRQRPPAEPGGMPPKAEAEEQNRRRREQRQRPPRQQRCGGESIAGARHWPSRSRIAGTCT